MSILSIVAFKLLFFSTVLVSYVSCNFCKQRQYYGFFPNYEGCSNFNYAKVVSYNQFILYSSVRQILYSKDISEISTSVY